MLTGTYGVRAWICLLADEITDNERFKHWNCSIFNNYDPSLYFNTLTPIHYSIDFALLCEKFDNDALWILLKATFIYQGPCKLFCASKKIKLHKKFQNKVNYFWVTANTIGRLLR